MLAYRNRQDELIDVLKQANELLTEEYDIEGIGLNDRNEQDEEIPLKEIDPFSFFASINRRMDREARIAVAGVRFVTH